MFQPSSNLLPPVAYYRALVITCFTDLEDVRQVSAILVPRCKAVFISVYAYESQINATPAESIFDATRPFHNNGKGSNVKQS